MKYLIGIDDTDNLDSRGTGWLARELGRRLEETGHSALHMITRHQLLVDEAIPYTSHNSSACLLVESERSEEIIAFTRSFLISESADGSDAGLCVASWDAVPPGVISWGHKAKKVILTAHDAMMLSSGNKIFLEGLTGTKLGVIGALAAVGLRKGGNDGRILWLPGLRDLQGFSTPARLKNENKIDRVLRVSGALLSLQEKIALGEWVRPVMEDHQSTLFVEEYEGGNCKYRTASKDFIKGISE